MIFIDIVRPSRWHFFFFSFETRINKSLSISMIHLDINFLFLFLFICVEQNSRKKRKENESKFENKFVELEFNSIFIEKRNGIEKSLETTSIYFKCLLARIEITLSKFKNNKTNSTQVRCVSSFLFLGQSMKNRIKSHLFLFLFLLLV